MLVDFLSLVLHSDLKSQCKRFSASMRSYFISFGSRRSHLKVFLECIISLSFVVTGTDRLVTK